MSKDIYFDGPPDLDNDILSKNDIVITNLEGISNDDDNGELKEQGLI